MTMDRQSGLADQMTRFASGASLRVWDFGDLVVKTRFAIQVDRENGTYSVNRVNGDSIEVVEVTIGLRDGQNTQITGGLEAGDEVLIGNELPTFEFGPGSRE